MTPVPRGLPVRSRSPGHGQSRFVMAAGLFLVLAALFCGCGPGVKVDGGRITIASGGNRIRGLLAKPSTYQMLFKDEARAGNTYGGDALAVVMDWETAEGLRVQYGDFFSCNSPGAEPSKERMETVLLVCGNPAARSSLKQAMELVRKFQIPVVRFDGSLIIVDKNTYLGMNVVDNTGHSWYYVTGLEIVKQNYVR